MERHIALSVKKVIHNDILVMQQTAQFARPLAV